MGQAGVHLDEQQLDLAVRFFAQHNGVHDRENQSLPLCRKFIKLKDWGMTEDLKRMDKKLSHKKQGHETGAASARKLAQVAKAAAAKKGGA